MEKVGTLNKDEDDNSENDVNKKKNEFAFFQT